MVSINPARKEWQMEKTKIEWAESTWNPVTGCYHGCPYCYARKIAERFKGCDDGSTYGPNHQATWRRVNPDAPQEESIFEVDTKCPPINIRFDPKKQKRRTNVAPYPWGFRPTLRRDRLAAYERKAGRTIFVCSMAELFGKWVQDGWIEEVFAACERAPQHRYLFLTKNPARYLELAKVGKLPAKENMWYGTTATRPDMEFFWGGAWHTFVSIEPMLKDYSGEIGQMCDTFAQWVIIGAETGNRKGKVTPEARWVREITKTCIEANISLMIKENMLPIVGEENMFRELPWDRETWDIERRQKWLDRYYKTDI